ncbi:thiamine biosynthesis protein MoeB [Bacillus sp. FJAT-27231]|uniref:ThiF family adenylyltransferase n=1 Tax=Bacillus sp. FJAT-27231 TaxID=1679168 RepID=UPI000670ADD9|nr:ThiF family adenylyltransferase [Bacillus sp. FJAT-27231]KMY54262.1 thiamine biosynthesis protein MoeB [Bacillus sp. FJAT-27231]
MQGRYSRQELFSPIGREGQRKLKEKHVLLVGAGALGTGNAEALVRAGIGRLTIIDRDYVEESNLQRQQLYSEEDSRLAVPKAMAAQQRLAAINSTVTVQAEVIDASYAELLELAEEADLMIDATDNYEARLMINDVAHQLGIPWIYGACTGSHGMVFVILPGETPCLRCLWERGAVGSGYTCDTAGIIGPAATHVVSYQVTEAMKILVEDWQALNGKLIMFDLWKNMHKEINVNKVKRKECPTCGESPVYPHLSHENLTKTSVLCGRNTVQIRPAEARKVNLSELEQTFAGQGYPVKRNPYMVTIHFPLHRLAVFHDGRMLVHGTNDQAEAKKYYTKLFG